jgi:hypothetical protein
MYSFEWCNCIVYKAEKQWNTLWHQVTLSMSYTKFTEEECDEENHWTCSSTTSSGHQIKLVPGSNSYRPEIRIITPTTDPWKMSTLKLHFLMDCTYFKMKRLSQAKTEITHISNLNIYVYKILCDAHILSIITKSHDVYDAALILLSLNILGVKKDVLDKKMRPKKGSNKMFLQVCKWCWTKHGFQWVNSKHMTLMIEPVFTLQ